MTHPIPSRTYDLWSKVYDATFGRLLVGGHKRAVQHLHLLGGQRILDVGVGTGIMLPYYPPDVTVVGVDLSGGMLARAAERCRVLGLLNGMLVRADAMRPPFSEGAFDHVIISHTISVVSDPGAVLRWASRLVRPGGYVLVLNHFRSDNPVIAWFETVFNPLFVRLGWRSDLSLEEVLASSNLRLEYRFKRRLLDLWQIVVLARQTARPQSDLPVPERSPGEEAQPGGKWQVAGGKW